MSYSDAAKSKNSRKLTYVRMNYLQPLDPALFVWVGKSGNYTTASTWFLPSDIPYSQIVLNTYSGETGEATGELTYWVYDPMGTQPLCTWSINGSNLIIASDTFNAEDGVYTNPVVYVKRVLRLSDSYYFVNEYGLNFPVEQRIKSIGNFSRKVDLVKNESFTVGKVSIKCINRSAFFNDLLDDNIFKSQKVEIFSVLFDSDLNYFSKKIGEFKIDEVDYGDDEDMSFNLLESSFMSVLTSKDYKTIDDDSTTHSPYGFVKNYKSEFPKLSGIKTMSYDKQDLIYVGTASIVSAFPNPFCLQLDDLNNLKHFPKGIKFLAVDSYDSSVFHNKFLEVISYTNNYFQVTDPSLSTDPTSGTLGLYVSANDYIRNTITNTITNNYTGDDSKFIQATVLLDAVQADKSIYISKDLHFLQPGDELALVYEDGTSHSIWIRQLSVDASYLKLDLYNQLAWDMDATTSLGSCYVLFNKVNSYKIGENTIRETKTRFEIQLPSDTIINAANWWATSGADTLHARSPYIDLDLQMVSNGSPLVNPGDFIYATGLNNVIDSLLKLNNDSFIYNQAAILYDERFPRTIFIEANYSPDGGFTGLEDVSNSFFTNGIYTLGYIHLDWFSCNINFSGIGIVDFDFSDNKINTTLNCGPYVYNKSKKVSYVNGSHIFTTYTSDPNDRIKRKITAAAQPGYYLAEVLVLEEVAAFNFVDPDMLKKSYQRVETTLSTNLFKDIDVGDIIMGDFSQSEIFRVLEKEDDNNIFVHKVPTSLFGSNSLRYAEWQDLGGTTLNINGCLTIPSLQDIVSDICEFSYGIDVDNKLDYNEFLYIAETFLPINRLGYVITKDESLYKAINKIVAGSTIVSYLNTDGKLTATLLDLDNLTPIKTISYYDLIKLSVKIVNNINSFFTLQFSKDSGNGSDLISSNYESESVTGLDGIVNIDKNTNLSLVQYSQFTADALASSINTKMFSNYKQLSITGTMDLGSLELGQVLNIVNYNRVNPDINWIVTEVNTNGYQVLITAISFYSPIEI